MGLKGSVVIASAVPLARAAAEALLLPRLRVRRPGPPGI
jgi:hypothetical protein